MIREYDNPKIKRDLKIIKILAIISLALSGVIIATCLPLDIIRTKKPFPYFSKDNLLTYILYMVMLPMIPLNILGATKKGGYGLMNSTEHKTNNDSYRLLTTIILSFIEVMYTVYMFLLSFLEREEEAFLSAFLFGRSLVSHAVSYVAVGFMIHMRHLVRKELYQNPPDYLKAEIAEKKLKKAEKDERLYKQLLEKCGMRFFIKYYAQINNLPLRDIVIYEAYTAREREERLNAAKRIVDSNLSKDAFQYIILNYSNILNENEISKAKNFLKALSAEESVK